MTFTDVSPVAGIDPSRGPVRPGRRAATARAVGYLTSAWAAVPLFVLWVTLAALTPLTVVAPMLVPITGWVRRYANAHRRAAGTVLGAPVPAPYRARPESGVLSRVAAVLRDPASWRDALWLLVHVPVAVTLSLVCLALLLGGVFYLIFPFLFAVTPQTAFGNAFGFVTITGVGQSFAFMPLALVGFGLWWWLAEPLVRAVARTDRVLLTPLR